MQNVKRVPSLNALREHVQRNEPCIYSVPKQMRLPFQLKWSKDFLAQSAGSTEVKVRKSTSRRFVDPAGGLWDLVQSMLLQKASFSEFLHTGAPAGRIMSGTETYLYQNGAAAPKWRALWPDAAPLAECSGSDSENRFFDPQSLNTIGLWVSGPGVKSILHFDDSGDNNLNFQVRGSKRVTLFPPCDWPKLKTCLALGLHDMEVYKQLYEQAPHTQGPAALSGTHPHTATLEQDDVLYIPSRWYHFVEHEGDFNINVTCWLSQNPMLSSENTVFPLETPGRSCDDYRLLLKLICAGIVAAVLNVVARTTGLRIGDWLCAHLGSDRAFWNRDKTN